MCPVEIATEKTERNRGRAVNAWPEAARRQAGSVQPAPPGRFSSVKAGLFLVLTTVGLSAGASAQTAPPSPADPGPATGPPAPAHEPFGPAQLSGLLGKRVVVRDIVGQDYTGVAKTLGRDRLELTGDEGPLYIKYKHIVSVQVVAPTLTERAADAALVAAGGVAAGAGAAATKFGERVGDALGAQTEKALDEQNIIERGIDLGFDALEQRLLGQDERDLDEEPAPAPPGPLGDWDGPAPETRREAFEQARQDRHFEGLAPPEELAPEDARYALGLEAGEAAAAARHFPVWFLGGLFAGVMPVSCCAALAVGMLLPARPPFDSGSRSKAFHEGFEDGYAGEVRFWRVASVAGGATVMVGLMTAGVLAAGGAYVLTGGFR